MFYTHLIPPSSCSRLGWGSGRDSGDRRGTGGAVSSQILLQSQQERSGPEVREARQLWGKVETAQLEVGRSRSQGAGLPGPALAPGCPRSCRWSCLSTYRPVFSATLSYLVALPSVSVSVRSLCLSLSFCLCLSFCLYRCILVPAICVCLHGSVPHTAPAMLGAQEMWN